MASIWERIRQIEAENTAKAIAKASITNEVNSRQEYEAKLQQEEELRLQQFKDAAKRVFVDSGALVSFQDIARNLSKRKTKNVLLKTYSPSYPSEANLFLVWGEAFSVIHTELIGRGPSLFEMIGYERPFFGILGQGIQDYNVVTATVSFGKYEYMRGSQN